MEFKDYYAVLGVSKTATDDEIKRAYRKLARKHHPDLNPGDKAAEARFKDLNEANEVLGDPDKRRKYDELGANWRQYEQQAPRPGPGFGAGPGGFRTMSPEEAEQLFGDGASFSDFFSTFFGGDAPAGARRPRGTRPRRGADVEAVVDMTLEEAFTGATRRVMVSRQGKARSVDVRIPAGVRDGAKVRASGEGEAGTSGPGDLYLLVRIPPHPRFERRGQDLHTRVAVPLTTAVLGGEISVPTLPGPALRLKVPELTTAGRVFRLRGHGMPVLGSGDERGDLYVAVDLQLPTQLSPDERRHFEALRALAGGKGEGAS